MKKNDFIFFKVIYACDKNHEHYSYRVRTFTDLHKAELFYLKCRRYGFHASILRIKTFKDGKIKLKVLKYYEN